MYRIEYQGSQKLYYSTIDRGFRDTPLEGTRFSDWSEADQVVKELHEETQKRSIVVDVDGAERGSGRSFEGR